MIEKVETNLDSSRIANMFVQYVLFTSWKSRWKKALKKLHKQEILTNEYGVYRSRMAIPIDFSLLQNITG